MDAANCIVDGPEDTSFIREPVGDEAQQWARICAQCPVFDQCLAWADSWGVTGVFAAGEWRE